MRQLSWKAASALFAACFGVAVAAQAQEDPEVQPTHPQGTHSDVVTTPPVDENETGLQTETEFDQQPDVLIVVPEGEGQAVPAAEEAAPAGGEMDVDVAPGTVDADAALPSTQPATQPTEQGMMEGEFEAQPAGEQIQPLRDKPVDQQLDAVRSEGVIDTTPEMDQGDREMELERDVRIQREGELSGEDYPATPPIDQPELGVQEQPGDAYDQKVDVDVPADEDPNVELNRDLAPSAETAEASEQRRLGVLEKENVNEAVPAADTQDVDEALQNLDDDREELDVTVEPATQPATQPTYGE